MTALLRRRLVAIAVLLGAALAGAGAWLVVGHLVTPDGNAAAEKLFALHLPDSDGKTLAFAQWRGKPMVVNFWATWCPPCREEMPLLDRVARANPGIQFVGISVDDKEHVAAFRSANPTSYPLPITGMDISPLAAELGNKAMALPFTVFVSADGTLKKVKLGALKEVELLQLVAAIKPADQELKSAK
ncbi:MAG: thioredoxin [Rhodocyclales bacterium]|nr:thioredoxin [Rhodocyclales bacterium]